MLIAIRTDGGEGEDLGKVEEVGINYGDCIGEKGGNHQSHVKIFSESTQGGRREGEGVCYTLVAWFFTH